MKATMKRPSRAEVLGFAKSYAEGLGITSAWERGDAPPFRKLFLFGCAIFITVLCSYTFFLFFYSGVVHFLSFIVISIAAYCVITYHRKPWIFHVSMTVLAAMFWGMLLGRFNYDNFSYYMFMYSNSRTYYDVVPSMPAASVADGGRLLFAKEARVDKAMSIGYAADDGKRYCVAPIRDLTETTRVEYWAIGTDCCDWMSGFSCGAADDADARGGAVVFNHTGILGSSYHMEFFENACRKAASTFELIGATRPVYVYWTTRDALEGLSGGFKTGAWIFIVLSAVGWGALDYYFLQIRYKRISEEV